MTHKFRIVKVANANILVQVESYSHLVTESIRSTLSKTMITLHKQSTKRQFLFWTVPDDKPPELIGYLQIPRPKDPIFVSVDDDLYVSKRFVFYGKSGKLKANEYLQSLSHAELLLGVKRMIDNAKLSDDDNV